MPAQETQSLDKRDWIAGLEKGLSLIEVFDDAHPRLTASLAGQRAGITRTAARRYLLTLQYLGYVASDGKLFWLTPRILRLGQSYLESARLPRIVQPFLQRVTAGTTENVYLGVLDGEDIVYIARNGTHRVMNTGYVVGSRVSAQVTAAGLVLMAHQAPEVQAKWLDNCKLKVFTSHTISDKSQLRRELAQVRSQGWAMSEQQLELNTRGIAVPLRDRNGEIVGSLSVTMPMGQESSRDAIKRVQPVLSEAAQAMRNLI